MMLLQVPCQSIPAVNLPNQPQSLSGLAINSTTIVLTWVEPHDNNAPIQGYRIMYTQPDFLGSIDEVVNVTVEMAIITGLHPGVTYMFTVVAFNEIGDSNPERIAVATPEEGIYIWALLDLCSWCVTSVSLLTLHMDSSQ